MKKNQLCNLFLILLLLTTLLSCSQKKLAVKQLLIITKEGQTYSIDAEIARTQEERNFGFMERRKIPNGTGMLFIFEFDQKLSFWMKNTPHPLSIAYIDSNGIIREIYDMTPFSLSSVESTVSVRYALEVPQGWFKINNIQPGDRISLP